MLIICPFKIAFFLLFFFSFVTEDVSDKKDVRNNRKVKKEKKNEFEIIYGSEIE